MPGSLTIQAALEKQKEFEGLKIKASEQLNEQQGQVEPEKDKFPFGLPGSTYNKGRNDPAFFATNILGLKIHPGQMAWLKRSKNGKNILVPSNQWGKTFVTAIKHIHMNFYRLGIPEKNSEHVRYQTLNISPRSRQAIICYRYIQDILQSRFTWFEGSKMLINKCRIVGFLTEPLSPPSVQTLSYRPLKFRQEKGGKVFHSEFWCIPIGQDGATGLAGDQFMIITFDEVGLYPHLERDLPGRIMSRLIKWGGNIDLIGTPDIDSDGFAYHQQLVEDANEELSKDYLQFGILDDNIFIPEESREKIKKSIMETSPELYAQVIEGRFVASGSHLFSNEAINNLFSTVNSEGRGKPPSYQYRGKEDHHYVIGVDWAMSNDYTVMIVIDYSKTPWTIARKERFKGNTRSPAEQFALLRQLKSDYNDAEVIMDTNGLGGAIIEQDLADIGATGFKFRPGEKAGLILSLKKVLYWRSKDGRWEGRLRSPKDIDLRRELGSYKLKDEGIVQDSVIALALACHYLQNEEYEEAFTFDLNIFNT